MNALFSQRVESFDKRYQYLLFAAEPYEIIAFKVGGTKPPRPTRSPLLLCTHTRPEFFSLYVDLVAAQVPSAEIDKSTPKFFSHWDPDLKTYMVRQPPVTFPSPWLPSFF